MKKFKLRQLLIDRADLVDKGANQEAFIELYKRDGSSLDSALERARQNPGGAPVAKANKRPAFLDGKKDPEEDAPKEEMMDEEEEDEEKVSKALDATLDAITKGLIEADVFVDSATTDDVRDMLPSETLSVIEEVLKSAGSAVPAGEADMSETVSATDLEDLVEYVEKLEADIVDLQKSLDDSTPPAEESEIAKAIADLPEDVAKAIEAERTELEEAREAVAKADIAKADAEYIAKATAMPGIVDSPEDFGPVLRQVAELNEELAKSIMGVLETANERIKKGDLFEEAGHGSTVSGGDAFNKATTIAKSMIDAGTETDLATARSKVWETNPDLYDEYQVEREAAK